MIVLSAEHDLATFLSRVHLMDLEPERPHMTPQQSRVAQYDDMTDWWRRRAADSLAHEGRLRRGFEFTETELRIARLVEQRRRFNESTETSKTA